MEDVNKSHKVGTHSDVGRMLGTFAGIAVLLLAGITAYAISTSRDVYPILLFAGTVGSAVLICGAHALAGGLLGFLFAIPRSRQQDPVPPNSRDQAKEDGKRKLSDYAANTNLEQISDWLTKIIVGASLVQLGEITKAIGELATALAPALGSGSTARPVVLCLIVFSFAWGFFFSYLVIRLWLPKALSRAERDEEIQNLQVELDAELRILERRAYNFLYEPPPGGYSRAIDAIEAYDSKSGAVPSAWLNVYLACAYGQKYAHEKLQAGTDAELQVRERVRKAVEEAIRLSPSTKAVLARLYAGRDGNEDDLASLNPDDKLSELLAGE